MLSFGGCCLDSMGPEMQLEPAPAARSWFWRCGAIPALLLWSPAFLLTASGLIWAKKHPVSPITGALSSTRGTLSHPRGFECPIMFWTAKVFCLCSGSRAPWWTQKGVVKGGKKKRSSFICTVCTLCSSGGSHHNSYKLQWVETAREGGRRGFCVYGEVLYGIIFLSRGS